MAILKTYARVWSDEMDSALRPLVELVGAECDLRFAFGDVEVAALGDFLVIAGTPEAAAKLPSASATVVVSDLEETRRLLTAHGAEITFGPAKGPTGSYFFARHRDGAEVEYVQWTSELENRILT
ncbi:VOC family protein [Streptomyces sp. GbtcB6]|uniref:VOC family protein n=1 Tax=Streptomyces sp. GbtcB6 TaxID=2824751 RepID=UPI001C2F9F26|nr:VOC family protein [Streptomyces sp. GbtcB6]